MRADTRKFIKANRGNVYRRKTGTLNFYDIKTGDFIPSHIAEELDRCNKFDHELVNFASHYTLR